MTHKHCDLIERKIKGTITEGSACFNLVTSNGTLRTITLLPTTMFKLLGLYHWLG